MAAAVEYLRKLAQGYATAGAPIPKGELGQLLAKKGYDAAERAAAFDAAVADDGGFLTVSSRSGTNVWFKVKPAQAPDAVACLRQLVDGYSSQGRPIPHKGDLGQLLRDYGYDADQRAAAFKAAVATDGGFLTPEGTGANLMFKLRAAAKRTVAPAAATTAKTVSEAVTLLKRFVEACGGTATPKTDFGQRLAEHGIGKKERVAAFTEAEGPNGFVDVQGQGASVMYVPRKAKATTVTSPPHLATSTNNEGAVAALRRFIEERGAGKATLKSDLGQMLAQKGYDAQQRAAAFAEAEDPETGFVVVSGVGGYVSYALRTHSSPPARGAVSTLRHFMLQQGSVSVRKSVVGFMLTAQGFTAEERRQAFAIAEAEEGGFVDVSVADGLVAYTWRRAAPKRSPSLPPPPRAVLAHLDAELDEETQIAVDELDAIGAPAREETLCRLLSGLGYNADECRFAARRKIHQLTSALEAHACTPHA